jgi:hypothetical protein
MELNEVIVQRRTQDTVPLRVSLSLHGHLKAFFRSGAAMHASTAFKLGHDELCCEYMQVHRKHCPTAQRAPASSE